MNSDAFVEAIKLVVVGGAVSGELENLAKPAGRKPRPALVEMSVWFNGLPEQDKVMVGRVIRDAVEFSVFNFFAVLDGVAVIENGPNKGELELYYVKGNERVRLNEPSNLLHDIFNAE